MELEEESVFRFSRIFKDVRGDRVSPDKVFLDSPYSDTGLAAYYDVLGGSQRNGRFQTPTDPGKSPKTNR